MKHPDKYVLMTAAWNEAAYIEATIQSVLAQTIMPEKWIIVSDGSTDDTDKIVEAYAGKHGFILYSRREKENKEADFASKVFAIRHGYRRLEGRDYDFIGNLDADITFDRTYFEKLFDAFRDYPRLGIAGGLLYEETNGRILPRSRSDMRYVPGAVQLFRRECYEQVGGYIPSRWGGEDTIAVVTARMKGWETSSVHSARACHHKVSENARGRQMEWFREGVMFHALGSHPLFELLKSLLRMAQKPYFIQGIVRICGYIWAACGMRQRPVSAEFIQYLRKEQMRRLKSLISND